MIAIYTLVFAAIMQPSLSGHDSPFAYSINLCAGISCGSSSANS